MDGYAVSHVDEIGELDDGLAGQTDHGIAHLRRAIELSERTRAFLKGDSDLDPIRQGPAFQQMLDG